MRKLIRVAIDGPSGSGKSTVARMVAQKFNLMHIDSGAMFRSFAIYTIRHPKSPVSDVIYRFNSFARFNFMKSKSTMSAGLSYNNNIICQFDDDDSEEIIRDCDLRNDTVASIASQLAQDPNIRKCLRSIQQRLGEDDPEVVGLVMEGRDIGTEVWLHQATLKVYLDASLSERSRRRFNEYLHNIDGSKNNLKQGKDLKLLTLSGVEDEMRRRDQADMERQYGPLRKAPDALVINTDHLSIDQVVNEISAHLNPLL